MRSAEGYRSSSCTAGFVRLSVMSGLFRRSSMAESKTSAASAAVIKHCFEPTPVSIVQRIPIEAELVLIGEASHGTREFYETRAEITKSLIAKHGFNAIATEAGVPVARTRYYRSPG